MRRSVVLESNRSSGNPSSCSRSSSCSVVPSLEEETSSSLLSSRPRLVPPLLTLSSPGSAPGGKPVLYYESAASCIKCKTCVGFVSHSWRNSCSLCKCSRAFHRERSSSPSRRLNPASNQNNNNDFNQNATQLVSTSTSNKNNNNNMAAKGYAWSPPGLSTGQVEDYMRELPPDKVPKSGAPGEKYREEQLRVQCPKQDYELSATRHVLPGLETSTYIDFVAARNNLALDVGKALDLRGSMGDCGKCRKAVRGIGILATRLGLDSLWHPGCFACNACSELLVDLKYCIHGDKLYCERHYAENFKPRCSACDELIFSGQYTKALGKDWHVHHFCCWHCDANLTGGRYVLTGKGSPQQPPASTIFSLTDDHPCCLTCFEENFTHLCNHCGKAIRLDSKELTYKDLHWHEACFICGKCSLPLLDSPFAAKESRIFCGPCYDAEFAARCDACGETFKIGHRKMEYKSRKWHDVCFKCVACSAEVGSHSFIIPNEKDVYCLPCFEDKFATKCNKCKKIMTTGGVTFKNEAWHRDCFVCCNCSTPLTGQKFASRNDKPYCADCFGELFAKRCTACTKPITGAGGTRFISFEGRHWHSHCFICALCKVSMSGKGFITDGEDILCTDCAKEKLMGGATAVTGSHHSPG